VKSRKILHVLLLIIMLVSLAPAPAFAVPAKPQPLQQDPTTGDASSRLYLPAVQTGMAAAPTVSHASHTPAPSSVTVAGSFQSELGCPGDWQPECTVTWLTYDAADDVWQAVFALPAGAWEYKAALNGSWDENYGANAQRNGPNIPLTLSAAASVKFYYDHKTHWITDNRNSVIATVPGSFQSEIGCPGDWQPDCLRSWLQDPDGDGVYTFSTNQLPPGNYEAKVAINESWDENYGQGGVPGGANIPFSVPVKVTSRAMAIHRSRLIRLSSNSGAICPKATAGITNRRRSPAPKARAAVITSAAICAASCSASSI
jgi:hypothetical protein